MVCKCSAENLGYFDDAFLKYFVPQKRMRRTPLIHRAYHLRVVSMRHLVRSFFQLPLGQQRAKRQHPQSDSPQTTAKQTAPLSGRPRRQVVSLGCGYDPSFFHFRSVAGANPVIQDGDCWFEVDFLDVVTNKAAVITKNEEMSRLVEPFIHDTRPGGSCLKLSSPLYKLLHGDLTDVNEVGARLVAAGFNPSLPTLFMSECVLMYLAPRFSDAIMAWAAKICTSSVAFVMCEQVGAFLLLLLLVVLLLLVLLVVLLLVLLREKGSLWDKIE
jgi:tRNA wybutosine-synthesizing protein 4